MNKKSCDRVVVPGQFMKVNKDMRQFESAKQSCVEVPGCGPCCHVVAERHVGHTRRLPLYRTVPCCTQAALYSG